MPIGSKPKKPREEHQTMLAKLLAKENITVRFGNYSTAFFEPKTRILGMPMWNAESKQVSDLLVGHEVGHALYTPVDGIEKFQKRFPTIPFDICNIIEDVRIERMIQSTYPGLVYSFREGYRSFVEKDLFKIKGVELSKLTVADRINLHAKIGHLIDIPLSAEERLIYTEAYSAKTFDDVLNIVEKLHKLVKESHDPSGKSGSQGKKQKTEKTEEQVGGSSGKASESKSESEGNKSDEKSDNTKPSQSEGDKSEGKESSKKDSDKPLQSDSAKSSESTRPNSDQTGSSPEKSDSESKSDNKSDGDKTESESKGDTSIEYSADLASNFAATHQREFDKGTAQMQENIDTIQVNVPTKHQIMQVVTPLKNVLESRRSDASYGDIMNAPAMVDSHKKFKESTKKHVQVLIKEFERRKAAYQYSRARRSTNGTLDVNRLHSYKYEDQVFRSVTNLADAKNHGMAFFIDYSGSMGRTIGPVLEQTIQLVTFCKAVNIPFVVYGFTSGVYAEINGREKVSYAPGTSLNLDYVNVFEILNSSVRKQEFETCLKEMYAMAWFRRNGGVYGYHCSSSYILFKSEYEVFGGTPLIESVVIATELVKQFRNQHSVQKMSVTFLTDGDPCIIHMHDNNIDKDFRKNTERFMNGYEMRFGGELLNWNYREPKAAMANAIRALRNITKSTVIGYFIADNQRSFKSHSIDAIRNVNREVSEWSAAADAFKSASREIRQNDGMFSIKNGGGYDMFFAFDGRDSLNIDDDDEFTSDVDMTDLDSASAQNKLAKEFTRFSSSKKSSRVFVHKFAEMIS